MSLRKWPFGCLLALAGCGSPDESPPVQPTGWDANLRLPEFVDLNPDPNVIEIELDAHVANTEFLAGLPTAAWTYNGSVPGPLIRAKVGDRLIVHFRNNLPEATTIHWHGLRVPAEMDGAPGHSQPEIPPNGEFTYDFTFPDAGTFWYHPHISSAKQVGNGLYGPIVVDAADEPSGLGDELVLVLSDIGLAADGSIYPPDAGGELGKLFGREGQYILANGKIAPVLGARSGLRQRWRVINAAITRYFELGLDGERITRIGGDGGLIASPIESDTVVLIPAERADVTVAPRGAPGSTSALRALPFDRGWGTTYNRPIEDVFSIAFSSKERVEPSGLPAIAREIAPLDGEGATDVTLDLTQTQLDDQIILGINGIPSWEAPPLLAKVDETQIWTVRNTMDFAHPFHLHGFFFQVLDTSGVVPSVLEWKDTANVPVGGALRFIVRYDERPGMWMFHCHILDHADGGMMGMLMLEHH